MSGPLADEYAGELRRLWRLRWLDSIQELSDYETQSAKWGKIDNPHYTYVEFVQCYFDDLGLAKSDGGYQWALDDGYVTTAELEAVQNWHRKLDEYKEPRGIRDEPAILADPSWQAIVSEGTRVQARLLELLTDETERWHLTHA